MLLPTLRSRMYVHGVLERALGGAQAHRRVAAPLVVDVGEQRLEPAVVGGIAGHEDVVGLDAHAVEGELGLGAAPQPHLAVRAGDAHAVAGQVDDDGADALAGAGLAAGEPAPHQAGHGLVAAGDVVLVGLEAPAVAVGGEMRPHGGGGGAGVGLGDADAEQLAGRGLRQPGGAQRLVAQVLDGTGRPVEHELAQDGAGHVDSGDLLEHDGGLDVAHAHAAVLLAHGDGEQVGPPQGLERRLGELLGLVPARRVGGDVALGHVTGQLAQRGPVLVLDEVDGAHAGRRPDTIVSELTTLSVRLPGREARTSARRVADDDARRHVTTRHTSRARPRPRRGADRGRRAKRSSSTPAARRSASGAGPWPTGTPSTSSPTPSPTW